MCFLVILVALVLRLALIDRFCLQGDEWYTIESSRELGTSYMGYPYFVLIKGILTLWGDNAYLLRSVSVLLATLGVGALFFLGKYFNNSGLGILTASLAATSSFQILTSLEIRYYGVYFFLAVLSLLLVLQYLQSHKLKHFIMVAMIALISTGMHFNMVFFWSGFAAYLLLNKLARAGFQNRVYLLMIIAVLLLVIFYNKEHLFSLAAKWGYKNASVSSGGMIGWSVSAVIKPFFALFSFIFGFNVSPSDYKIIIPFGALISVLAVKGIIYSRKHILHPLLFWTCFAALPLTILFLIIEPLSTQRFAGILAPKHVMFSYPLYVLALALGIESLKKKAVRVAVLTIVFTFHFMLYAGLFQPAYSYYAESYVDYRKTEEILKQTDLSGSLFVVDSRAERSLEFYNRDFFRRKAIINPWNFSKLSPQTIENAPFVVFATNNWKEINKPEGDFYENLGESIYRTHQLVDGFVDYPFFFYVFNRKTNVNAPLKIPVEPYGFRYADLRLPVKAGNMKILGSARLSFRKPSLTVDFPADRETQKITLFYNLEDSDQIPAGAVVGELVLMPSEKKIKLIKNENAFDVFSEMDKNIKIPEQYIAHTWIKQPLISSAQKFKGARKAIRSHIYKIQVPLSDTDTRMKIQYTSQNGGIRIWGAANE